MFYVLIAIYDDLTSTVGRFANAFRLNIALLRSDESDAVFRRTAFVMVVKRKRQSLTCFFTALNMHKPD